MASTGFEPTLPFYDGFEDTMMSDKLTFAVAHPSAAQRDEMHHTASSRVVHRTHGSGKSEVSSFEWSGMTIIVVVILAAAILLAPSYSEWFRNWSGIDSWIAFFKNVFGL
jgi:hypothetical protein